MDKDVQEIRIEAKTEGGNRVEVILRLNVPSQTWEVREVYDAESWGQERLWP